MDSLTATPAGTLTWQGGAQGHDETIGPGAARTRGPSSRPM